MSTQCEHTVHQLQLCEYLCHDSRLPFVCVMSLVSAAKFLCARNVTFVLIAVEYSV